MFQEESLLKSVVAGSSTYSVQLYIYLHMNIRHLFLVSFSCEFWVHVFKGVLLCFTSAGQSLRLSLAFISRALQSYTSPSAPSASKVNTPVSLSSLGSV